MLLQWKGDFKTESELCILTDLLLYFTWLTQKLEWTLLFSVHNHFLALCPDQKSPKLSHTECWLELRPNCTVQLYKVFCFE